MSAATATHSLATPSADDAVLNSFASAFEAALPRLPGHANPTAQTIRKRAFVAFAEMGLPNKTLEAWKYFPSTQIKRAMEAPAEAIPTPTSDTRADGITITLSEHGATIPDLLPAGLEIHSIAAQLEAGDTALIKALETQAAAPLSALNSLNLALLQGGIVITTTPGAVISEPIRIHHQAGGHQRILVTLGADSQLTLVETFDAKSTQSWHNPVVQIDLAKGASLSHYTIQHSQAPLHTATLSAMLETRSSYRQWTVNLGGDIARRESQIHLNGEHAVAEQYGVFAGRNSQLRDHYMPIWHHAPHCKSRQWVKGVLDDQAQGVFYGKIIVPKGAIDSEAHQQSRALLLSNGAEADNRPELEIHCDEVVCSHGAAIGQLDDDALYYLQARGLSEDAARRLLIQGYLDEVLDTIEDESLRSECLQAVEQWRDA